MGLMSENLMEICALVAERGSFSEAARELGVPPSTVSRQVTRLEEHLGVALFLRSTRHLQLTEAGRRFMDKAQVALEATRAAEEAARSLGERPQGPLRVAAPQLEAPNRALDLLLEFAALHPDVSLDLVMGNQVVDLVAERIDVALRAGVLADSTLVARKVGDSRRVLMASPEYLARRGHPQDIAALQRGHEALCYSAEVGWPLRSGQGRVQIEARMRANSLGVLAQAALRGFGLALLPELQHLEHLASGALVPVLPEVVGDVHGFYLLYSTRRHLSGAARALIDFLTARSLLPPSC